MCAPSWNVSACPCMFLGLSLSLSIYIYICVCVCVCEVGMASRLAITSRSSSFAKDTDFQVFPDVGFFAEFQLTTNYLVHMHWLLHRSKQRLARNLTLSQPSMWGEKALVSAYDTTSLKEVRRFFWFFLFLSYISFLTEILFMISKFIIFISLIYLEKNLHIFLFD